MVCTQSTLWDIEQGAQTSHDNRLLFGYFFHLYSTHTVFHQKGLAAQPSFEVKTAVERNKYCISILAYSTYSLNMSAKKYFWAWLCKWYHGSAHQNEWICESTSIFYWCSTNEKKKNPGKFEASEKYTSLTTLIFLNRSTLYTSITVQKTFPMKTTVVRNLNCETSELVS
jgi:hypothetical protein